MYNKRKNRTLPHYLSLPILQMRQSMQYYAHCGRFVHKRDRLTPFLDVVDVTSHAACHQNI